ncbi:hypothetical protein Tco_0082426 [Tanacetum coccineum]
MLKGCPVFLAHVTTKETEDKSENKRLEDVLIIRDFPEVFPEDLVGLPPTRQVEFQIDLIPGVALVITSFEYVKKIFRRRHSELDMALRVPSYAIWFDEYTGGIYGSHELRIPKVQFLGHVIDSQGIHVDLGKIESIKDWASPKTPTKIAKSMTKLTQKGVKFD